MGYPKKISNNRIEDAAVANKMDVATTLRTQYGFGDEAALDQLDDILDGKTKLAYDKNSLAEAQTTSDGTTRTVYLNNYKEGMSDEEQFKMGIELGHEAHRDGIVGNEMDQAIETVNAVVGHTVMAMRMQSDPKYKDMMEGIISNDAMLGQDIDALKNGDMIAHVLENYDTSADYWKMMEDGSLEFDGDGWLKDSNGNQIDDENGNPIGAAGIETGLLNILNGQTSGKGYNEFNGAQKILAQDLMRDASIDSYYKDESKMGINNKFWDDKDNMGKAIRLDNGVYRDIYNDTRLYEHNTKYIYDTLVANGQMDVTHVGAHPTRDPGTQSGLLDGFDYISYEDYKANNFFAGDILNNVMSDKLPLQGEAVISSPFGPRAIDVVDGQETLPYHLANDWVTNNGTQGKEIYALLDSTLIHSGFDNGFGNFAIYEHELSAIFKGKEITFSIYSESFHLQEYATNENGKKTEFRQNEVLAKAGDTGTKQSGAHLHQAYYFRENLIKDNPLLMLLNMQPHADNVIPHNTRNYFNPLLFN